MRARNKCKETSVTEKVIHATKSDQGKQNKIDV
jgi:hypothetical protein